jgi:hypothetical protein
MNVCLERRPGVILCVLWVLLCGGCSAGCGYTLAGRGTFLPASIKTIGVPSFTNRTTIFNFETQLTQKVRAEFIGRGKYQIVPDNTGVDAVIIGEISSARIDPTSINPQTGFASGYTVTVTAKVELRTLPDNQVLWQNPAMAFREDYAALSGTSATDPNAFFGQDANALDRMSTDFARAIVSAILEAF